MLSNLFISQDAKLFEIGRGFNVLNGDILENGVSFQLHKPEEEWLESKLQAKIIRTAYEFDETISTYLGIEASYGFFKASASYRQTMTTNINRQASHVLVWKKVEKKIERADALLSNNALEILNNGGPKEFRQRYGDGYARAFINGGVLLAIISVRSENTTYQESVATQLSADLSQYGSVSAEHKKEIEEKKFNTIIEITLYRQGGRDTHKIITLGNKIEDLERFVGDFVDDVKKHPMPLTVEIAQYSSLENFPFGTSLVDIYERSKTIEKMFRLYQECQTIVGDLNEIIVKPSDYFDPPEEDDLKEWLKNYQEELRRLQDRAEEISLLKFDDLSISAVKVPEGFRLPRHVSYLTRKESKLLGLFWHEREGATSVTEAPNGPWRGMFSRNGDTRFFSAVWERDSGTDRKAVANLRIHMAMDSHYENKGVVKIRRLEPAIGVYTGCWTGDQAGGTYTVNNTRDVWFWSSKIQGQEFPLTDDGADDAQEVVSSRFDYPLSK